MSDLSFEEHFYSQASFVPELISKHFKLSSWRKDDIALALYGTKIVSLRILQEFDEKIENVHHVISPIITKNSAGITLETSYASYMEWVTLESGRGDVSYRISLIFQDAISLQVDCKSPFVCLACGDKLEECHHVSNDNGETYALEPIEILKEPWWEDSWDGSSSSTPRLLDIDVCDQAISEFVFHIADALAHAISRSGFELITAKSDLSPLLMVCYLWDDLIEKVKAL